MAERPAQPNQSLIDGLAVLQAVSGRREPVAGAELARELGLEPTRVNRLLKTLAYLEIVHRTPRRKYAPGPGMHVLAAQSLFASGLIRRALEPLAELSALGLTVALGVLWRDSVCYLYHWHPGLPVAEALGRTALFPATRSSLGLALLAARGDEAARGLYAGRDTPGFAELALLLAELARIRQRGYAVAPTEGGLTVGVACGQPPVAGIALAGPAEAVAVDDRIEHLRRTAARIDWGAGR